MTDPREVMEAATVYANSLPRPNPMIGVLAMESIGLFSEKERRLLAKLRPCVRCGLLDEAVLCGDCR